MTKHETFLKIILRIVAVVMLAAIIPAFMPFAWMDSLHQSFLQAELPDQPIVGYLARSLSAMYAIFGAALIFASLDVRRYKALLCFFGVVAVIFGVFMLGLDIHVGLPVSWIAGEGPFIIAFGLVILWLVRKVRVGNG